MVGIAVVGGGIFAREAHIPALLENNANILAVYSRSAKSAESVVAAVSSIGGPKAASSIETYSDEKGGDGLKELLKRSDISAVVVCLPILVQPDVVRTCFAAGKHVICEKPIAKDVESGLKLVEEYEQSYAPKGLVFSVAEQFRYDLGFSRARELVASGKIGDLTHAHARVWWNVLPGSKFYETAWRKEPEYQGGFILDGGVHFVALVRTVAGQEITETRAIAAQHSSHLPPTDAVDAGLRFSGGATGSLSLSCASKKSAFEYIFIGTKGSLTITNTAEKRTKLTLEDGETKEQKEEVVDGKALFEEFKAFLQAAESGNPDKYGSPREAVADVAVIQSICSGGGKVLQHS